MLPQPRDTWWTGPGAATQGDGEQPVGPGRQGREPWVSVLPPVLLTLPLGCSHPVSHKCNMTHQWPGQGEALRQLC